jgi:molybdate transport system ATP-binding protein
VLARPRSAFAAQIAGLNLVRGAWRDGVVVTTSGERIAGILHGPAPQEGDVVTAVFRPESVAVYAAPPHGSPRNSLAVGITDLEPHGGRVRVRSGDLAADITAAAAAELDLAPGSRWYFVVKASEVAVYAQ